MRSGSTEIATLLSAIAKKVRDCDSPIDERFIGYVMYGLVELSSEVPAMSILGILINHLQA